MAFLAVTSLMRTVELQFLHPQPRVILTNKAQIKSLHEKLGHLLVYLEECEKKGNNCAEMKELAEKIRKVSVKAEDDIEAELLNVHHYHNLDQALQRVVEDIEELMQTTRNTNHHLIVNNLTAGGPSQPTSNVEDNAMVGHSEELDEVKSQLFRDSLKQRQVMAMVGMGGIGKTTFAKRIYNDPLVTSHFKFRAWTTLSQEHDKRQALTDLIRCILPMSNKNIVSDDPDDLLRRSLLGQRYLIVLDDIWTTKAWDDIQRCFPDDNNGSRILLTTRVREIAEYANSGEYSYNLRFLNPYEGWDLFYQKLLDKEFLNNEFETIGKNIVQKCHGLPITIVVAAGLLSTINKSVDEWKKIEATINSLQTLDHDQQFSRILELSYNNMPSHLKGCFLYLGIYHEDCDIPVKKLIRLWIAEGFVETMSNRRLEEVGGNYLQDLIDRCLVMVHGRSSDHKIKTCRMHDLLRELCVSKAKKENLLYLETTGSCHGFDRLVRLGDKPWLSLKVVNPHFHLAIASRKCRTILCFNMVGNCDYEWYLHANSFKKLRVLDLSKINFRLGMPPDITDLVFLRYLEIASSKVLNCIPLWKNWNLQTLVVTEDDNGARRLPPGIWDLPQLRHLEINHQVPIYLPKMVQENLQTLYWLSTSQCTIQVFMRIPNVKDLGIIFARCQVSSQGLNDLWCLNHLEKLRVRGSYHPLHLPPLFPQNLKELTFERTLIPWEAMTIISLLPNLKVLKLKNFACVGQEWELIEDGSFPQLKVLLISLTNLKEWKAYVASPFPNLEHLHLRNCFELKEMPEWIADIITLQLIKLEYCYSTLVTSAMTVKEDQLHNYGNDMLHVLHFHTRPDEDHVGVEEEYSNEQISGEECAPNSLTSLWFEARKLTIPGGEEPSYWSWTLDPTGYEVAELLQMSWFEIGFTCDIRCLSKMTCYSAYLVFKLVQGGFKDVNTALTCVRYAKDKNLYGKLRGQNRNSQVFLAKTKSYGDCGQFPNDDRSDGWMEIKLGDFYVSSGNEGEVEFQLWHVSDQYWLSGFVVKGIEVRPAN
ncbi:PREDICTED: putative late blight resistance protein homolog R1A-10 isoform X1 [Ipomoea nil]|uniref:putative late blight resistance protein homolog R1A-10 isoform X1 n=2 Tax=Ipomoea nil TaxID=35883 RepID=UPI000901B90C|nr:PREDICTED: putative late blight resistance protein homolog R1A-10 isoform X1 [Ipomoea nil]